MLLTAIRTTALVILAAIVISFVAPGISADLANYVQSITP